MVKHQFSSADGNIDNWMPVNIQVSAGKFGVFTLYFANLNAEAVTVDVAVAASDGSPGDSQMFAPDMTLQATGTNQNIGEVKCHGVLSGERVFVRPSHANINVSAQALAQTVAGGVANG